jgi:aerobic C4-dicarboxylate transport protein
LSRRQSVAVALILRVDRFMSECRSLTNFIGNAVAALVVAKWENALDSDLLDRTLAADIRLDTLPGQPEEA